ncbi:MAG: tetratricopeptide repeat protein [Spirochaetia bacterium]|nr:tetratricopeptide repeat protein [Spirochaetia bacterium]
MKSSIKNINLTDSKQEININEEDIDAISQNFLISKENEKPEGAKKKGNIELDIEQLDNLVDLRNEATSLYRRKQFVEALGRLEDAIRILPGDLELLFFEAQCLYQLGNLDRAEKILSQLFELDEGRELTHLPRMLGLCLLKLEKYKEAEKFLKNITENYRNDIQLKGMLGFALERQDKLDDAALLFERIIKEDPENVNACNSLAYIYYRQNKRLDKALSLVKRALRKEPENAAYLDTIGMILFKRGDTTQARKSLKKAVKLAPQNKTIMSHLGEMLRI